MVHTIKVITAPGWSDRNVRHRVTGSTVNGTGSFVMSAERVGSDTLLAQIVRMVSEAQRSRAPIQKMADVVSSYFVPVVLLVAVITFIVWSLVGPEPRMAAKASAGRESLPLRAGTAIKSA